MRRMAELAGISNPYLSQIERGLREPSEKVLDALAGALELSAEAVYEQTGRARPAAESEPGEDGPSVADAVRADPRLTARQRQALLEVYDAFTGRRARPRGRP